MELHEHEGAGGKKDGEVAAVEADAAGDASTAHQCDVPGDADRAAVPDEADAPGDEAGAAEAEQDASRPRDEPRGSEGGSLGDDLAEARRAAQDNLNRALRAQAELENARRRLERDLEKAHKFALERFVSDLLPVKDSLELGLQAASAENASPTTIAEGIELTLRMFEQVLEKFGIATVDPAGESFNPEFHQAMTVQESETADSGTILSVIQKGYVLNERLVRPAMVIVAK